MSDKQQYEYAQALPEWNDREDAIVGWWVHKSFGEDCTRALDEGYYLVRRPIGEWEMVPLH